MSGRISRPKVSFSDIVKLGPVLLQQRENGAVVPVLKCVTRTCTAEILTHKNFDATLKEARRVAALCGPNGHYLAQAFLKMAEPLSADLADLAREICPPPRFAQKGLSA